MDVAVPWSLTNVSWCVNSSWSQRKRKRVCYPKTAGDNQFSIRSAPKIVAELGLLLKNIEALEGSAATQTGMGLALQLISDILAVFFPK